jgi:uncharacterized repeat protein (TIGR01451 family)
MTVAFGVSPGLKTTDEFGDEVQQNHYDSKQDVYLYGSNIPDGNYYVRVTGPSGNDNLGTSTTANLVVSGGQIIPNPVNLWSLVEFDNTNNTGGVYKVMINMNPDFGSNSISTKTFKVGEEEPTYTYSLTIDKTASPTMAYVGTEITYTIVVINTGTGDLLNVLIEDSNLDYSETFAIASGQSKTVTLYETYNEEGTYTNTATAEAADFVQKVSDDADVVIENIPDDPEYGTLTIVKEVYIDGDLDEENQSVFTFEVDGETVTASAIQSGQILLEVGTYTVTETGYGMYTPDATTQQAIVTTEGGLVTFVNRYTTPDDPEYGTLTIAKEVYIDGDLDEENQSVFTFEVDGETVTASAIQSGQILLEVGTYTVTETGYGMYTPDATTQQAIVTTEGGLVTFVNRYTTQDDPEYGRIRIEKTVTGNRSNGNDEFEFEISPLPNGEVMISEISFPQTVIASGNQDGLSEELLPGWYVVTELSPSPYTLQTANNVQVEVVAGQTASVSFTNRYNVSSPPPSSTYDLTITKTADVSEVEVGDTITYTIVVRNTGTGTLTNIRVVDEMIDLDTVIDSLAPNATRTFTATIVAGEEGVLENTVTATNTIVGTKDDTAIVIVDETPLDVPETPDPEEPVVEEPVEEVEIEEETPLDIPATGVDPMIYLYGLGSIASGIGAFIKRKKK